MNSTYACEAVKICISIAKKIKNYVFNITQIKFDFTNLLKSSHPISNAKKIIFDKIAAFLKNKLNFTLIFGRFWLT